MKESFSLGDIYFEPRSLLVKQQGKTVIEAYKKGKKIWRSHPMALVSIEKGKFDGKKEVLFTLENYYSSIDAGVHLRPYVYCADEMGLVARWRGSALAWPLLDAFPSQEEKPLLCALHRGDSYISLDSTSKGTRVAVYRWNGFGFSGMENPGVCKRCEEYFLK